MKVKITSKMVRFNGWPMSMAQWVQTNEQQMRKFNITPTTVLKTVAVIEGEQANLVKFLTWGLDDRGMSETEIIKKLPELASPEYLEQKKVNELTKEILSAYDSHTPREPKERAAARALISRHKMDSATLYGWGDLVIDKDYAEEFISVSTRASVWTYYVDAHIDINGKRYEALKVQYSSDVHRI